MAKGTHLTPEVKSLIAQTHLEHPDYGPTLVREKLLKRMKETGLDRNFGSDWPSVSAVGKVLTDIRKEESELGPDPEDRPWSVSALADCDIPAEALPVVMDAWAKALVNDDPLTIRQVKWIAYLYHVLKDRDTDLLAERALEYASLEKAIKGTGTYPAKPQDAWWLWFKDAILYFNMAGDDSPLVKCIKHMKWETTTDIDELKLIFERLYAISVNGDAFRREDESKGGTQ